MMLPPECFTLGKNGWLLPAVWQLYTQACCHHHQSPGSSLRYIPRRAVLYCPGNDERKLKKLALLDVDCAVLDCEDGVALTKKKSPGCPPQNGLLKQGDHIPLGEQWESARCSRLKAFSACPLNRPIGPAELPMKS
ncbi:hypothetical protein AMECASPLE_038625 [Ameca splendens]|uniref:Citrate lyase subunit beta-like protein n=1 Tax=Ameca splendens TaxID=208324 RepID=A0ABV0YVE7_9TELE